MCCAEGLYAKWITAGDQITPLLNIQRVNGDGSISRIVCTEDEARALIEPLKRLQPTPDAAKAQERKCTMCGQVTTSKYHKHSYDCWTHDGYDDMTVCGYETDRRTRERRQQPHQCMCFRAGNTGYHAIDACNKTERISKDRRQSK